MKVNLIYYKITGKYYGEGSYETSQDDLWRIWGEVKEMLNKRDLPGLMKGCSEFIISVDVPDHQHNHPTLILPESIAEYCRRLYYGN